jgi:nucleoside-diphosphate-sugar epimerase
VRILITGGSGYLGTRLADFLRKQKHEVSTLSNDKKAKLNVDISNFAELKKAVKGFDMVFHLAALIDTKQSFERPMEYFYVNSVGTLNVLEAARVNDVKRILLTSSVKVYGKPAYLPYDEKHPTVPISPYGYSKLAAEEFCRSYGSAYSLSITIARLANIYGPNQSSNLFIPTVLSQLDKDKIMLRNLSSKRDYIYVDDVISALNTCLEKGVNDVFNFGSGKSYSVKEILDIISKLVGKKLNVEVNESSKTVEADEEVADIRKAKSVLGWQPKVSMEEGLKRILESR